MDHWGPIGIVPASIHMTVLDADVIPSMASLKAMVDRLAYVEIVPSRKSDRAHVYVRDDIGRTNGRFECFGIRGDIRSASGYAILWGEAVTCLAEAVRIDLRGQGGKLGTGQMEQWVISKGGKLKVRANPVRKRGRGLKSAPKHLLKAGGTPNVQTLRSARIGERNETVFDALRHWAYRRRRGNDYGAWRGLVRQCARGMNALLMDPLDNDEINRTADSVADFCWTQLEEIVPRVRCTKSEEQAARGRKSGRVRRWNSVHLRDDPKPWLKYGIARSTYYAKLQAFRDRNPGATGRPPDRIFARQTAEEAQEQRCRAARISGRRRTERAGGEHQASDRFFAGVQRAGRNLNHQQRPKNRGAAGRIRGASTPSAGPVTHHSGTHRTSTITGRPAGERLTPHQRERQSVARAITALQSGPPRADTQPRGEPPDDRSQHQGARDGPPGRQ